MFSKLAQKYKVPSPLDEAGQSRTSHSKSVPPETVFQTNGKPIKSAASGNIESTFINQKTPLSDVPFLSSTTPVVESSSPFGATGFNPVPSFGTQATPFAQTSSSFPSSFGQGTALMSSPTPFPAIVSSPGVSTTATTSGGKTARELLTQFYQEKNPSKIGEVEKLLVKYQVRIQ